MHPLPVYDDRSDCRGQDFGDAIWHIISAILPRAISILVWGGVVTLSIGSNGKAIVDLSGNQPLGAYRADAAQQLGKTILGTFNNSKPSLLTTLNLR